VCSSDLQDYDEITTFTCINEQDEISLRVNGPKKRSYIMIFNAIVRMPENVEIDKGKLQRFGAELDFNRAVSGWWIDATGRLIVKAEIAGDAVLKIGF
jgi:hypothetical protein